MLGTKREGRGTLTAVAAALAIAIALGSGATAQAQAPPAAHKAAGAKKPAMQPAPAEPEGYWTGEANAPVPASIHGGKVIHVQQLTKLVLAADGTIVLDVSSVPVKPDNLATDAQWLPPLHRGIPGARWIPGVGLGEVPTNVDSFFRTRLATLTGNDFEKPIVIYCHEKCWLSWNAAKRAIGYGYHNVSWFPEGIEGWRATGLATTELQPESTPHDTEAAPAA